MLTDRTSELLSFVQSLPPPPSGAPLPLTREQALTNLSKFHTLASTVSNQITSTSHLLQRLSVLVQKKSVFDDKSSDINSLVERIKSDLSVLNTSLETCQAFLDSTKSSMNSGGADTADTKNHTTAVLTELKKSVLTASTSFKKSLQKRSDNIKQIADRKDILGGGAGGGLGGGLTGGGLMGGGLMGGGLDLGGPISLGLGQEVQQVQQGVPQGAANENNVNVNVGLHQRSPNTKPSNTKPSNTNTNTTHSQGSYYNNVGNGSGNNTNTALTANAITTFANGQYNRELELLDTYDNSSGTTTASNTLTPYELQQLDMEGGNEQSQLLIPQGNTYLNDRANAVSQIESHIAELGSVFGKLASMINEHSELVQRVEDNVDETNENVSSGLVQLNDTLSNLTSNRGLMLKVMGILTAFIVFFITFLA
jgi:syntaxin 5